MSLPVPDTDNPTGWVLVCPSETDAHATRLMALQALGVAREMAPKVSGRGAALMRPRHGQGWFGLTMPEHMVHTNRGTRPRVMRELSGKGPIPMWITDHDGTMTAKVPAHKRSQMTRITVDGRRQVKIFRMVPPIGSRKNVRRGSRVVSVPRHYPGAPGRIDPRTGRFGGVWWRHPGIRGRQYVEDALAFVAEQMRVEIKDIYPARLR